MNFERDCFAEKKVLALLADKLLDISKTKINHL